MHQQKTLKSQWDKYKNQRSSLFKISQIAKENSPGEGPWTETGKDKEEGFHWEYSYCHKQGRFTFLPLHFEAYFENVVKVKNNSAVEKNNSHRGFLKVVIVGQTSRGDKKSTW